MLLFGVFAVIFATTVVIINFSYRVYFNCELLRFCYVEVEYYGLEVSSTYNGLLSWIWICFPICLGLLYMAFRLMSHLQIETLDLHCEPRTWQVPNSVKLLYIVRNFGC